MNDRVDLSGSVFHNEVSGKYEHHHHYGPAPTATAALPAALTVFTGCDPQVDELLAALDPGARSTAGPVLIIASATRR